MLEDTDCAVRPEVVEAFGRIYKDLDAKDKRRILSTLESMLEDTDCAVRPEVVEAFGRIYKEELEKHLQAAKDAFTQYAGEGMFSIFLKLSSLSLGLAEDVMTDKFELTKDFFHEKNLSLEESRRIDEDIFWQDNAHKTVCLIEIMGEDAFIFLKRFLKKDPYPLRRFFDCLDVADEGVTDALKALYSLAERKDFNSFQRILEISSAYISIGKKDDLLESLKPAREQLVPWQELSDSLAKAYLDELAASLGITASGIRTEVLSRFHILYAGRFKAAMEFIRNKVPDKLGLFKAVLKAMFEDRFHSFLTDTSQDDEEGAPLAEHNKNVRKAITDCGISPDSWLSYSRESLFSFSERNLKIDPEDEMLRMAGHIASLHDLLESAKKQGLSNLLRKLGLMVSSDKDAKLRLMPISGSAGRTRRARNKVIDVFKNIKNIESVKKAVNYLARNVEDSKVKEVILHLASSINDLKKLIQNPAAVRELAKKKRNFTLRMWKRDPPHDLFLGDFVSCCLATNSNLHFDTMIDHLIDQGIQVAEVIDDDTSKTIALAWLFLAKNRQNRPYLIIDNIEINDDYSSVQPLKDRIKEALIDYTIEYASSIGVKTVLAGTSGYSKVTLDEYETEKFELEKIGGYFNNEKYYLEVLENDTMRVISEDIKHGKGAQSDFDVSPAPAAPETAAPDFTQESIRLYLKNEFNINDSDVKESKRLGYITGRILKNGENKWPIAIRCIEFLKKDMDFSLKSLQFATKSKLLTMVHSINGNARYERWTRLINSWQIRFGMERFSSMEPSERQRIATAALYVAKGSKKREESFDLTTKYIQGKFGITDDELMKKKKDGGLELQEKIRLITAAYAVALGQGGLVTFKKNVNDMICDKDPSEMTMREKLDIIASAYPHASVPETGRATQAADVSAESQVPPAGGESAKVERVPFDPFAFPGKARRHRFTPGDAPDIDSIIFSDARRGHGPVYLMTRGAGGPEGAGEGRAKTTKRQKTKPTIPWHGSLISLLKALNMYEPDNPMPWTEEDTIRLVEGLDIREGSKVLDVGSGNYPFPAVYTIFKGAYLDICQPYDADVDVDEAIEDCLFGDIKHSSPDGADFVEKARKRLRIIRRKVEDAREIKDNDYNVVFLLSVLDCPGVDAEAVAAKALRSLKNNGLLVVRNLGTLFGTDLRARKDEVDNLLKRVASNLDIQLRVYRDNVNVGGSFVPSIGAIYKIVKNRRGHFVPGNDTASGGAAAQMTIISPQIGGFDEQPTSSLPGMPDNLVRRNQLFLSAEPNTPGGHEGDQLPKLVSSAAAAPEEAGESERTRQAIIDTVLEQYPEMVDSPGMLLAQLKQQHPQALSDIPERERFYYLEGVLKQRKAGKKSACAESPISAEELRETMSRTFIRNMFALKRQLNRSDHAAHAVAITVLKAIYLELIHKGKMVRPSDLEKMLNYQDESKYAIDALGVIYAALIERDMDVPVPKLEKKLGYFTNNWQADAEAFKAVCAVYAAMVKKGKDVSLDRLEEVLKKGWIEVGVFEVVVPALASLYLTMIEKGKDVPLAVFEETLFKKRGYYEREILSRSLGTIYAALLKKNKTSLADLENKSRDTNPGIRGAAVNALGRAYTDLVSKGAGVSIEALKNRLSDVDAGIRLEAAQSLAGVYVELANHDGTVDLEDLETAISGYPYSDKKTYGALSLAYAALVKNGKMPLSDLEKKLDDKGKYTACAAIICLSSLYAEAIRNTGKAPKDSIERISGRMNDENEDIAYEAIKGTGCIYAAMVESGQPVPIGSIVNKLMADRDKPVVPARYAAIEAVAAICIAMINRGIDPPRAAISGLEWQFKDSKLSACNSRREALWALCSIYRVMADHDMDVPFEKICQYAENIFAWVNGKESAAFSALCVTLINKGINVPHSMFRNALNEDWLFFVRDILMSQEPVYEALFERGDVPLHDLEERLRDDLYITPDIAKPATAFMGLAYAALIRQNRLSERDWQIYEMWLKSRFPRTPWILEECLSSPDPLTYITDLARESELLLKNGFDPDNEKALWRVYVGLRRAGIDINFGGLKENVEHLMAFDKKHPGYFANMFNKAGILSQIQISGKGGVILDASGVDAGKLDKNLAKLKGMKERIDSLRWLEEDFPGNKVFNLKNIYYLLKRREAEASGAHKGGRFVVTYPSEDAMGEYILQNSPLYYRLVFELALARMGDGVLGKRCFALARDLIVSEALSDEILVGRMGSADTDVKTEAFKNFYENYKNHLPDSAGVRLAKIKGMPEAFGELSGEVYSEISKVKVTKNRSEGAYRLVPQGFLSVFRGIAGIKDCSYGLREACPRPMHEDTLYYFVYKGEELKGYIGMCVGKTRLGKKILTIDTVQSPSLDGEELLACLFWALDAQAKELGCAGIALPRDLAPSFNFSNKDTISRMKAYSRGRRIRVTPVHSGSWKTMNDYFGEDEYNSIEDGQFVSLNFKYLSKPESPQDSVISGGARRRHRPVYLMSLPGAGTPEGTGVPADPQPDNANPFIKDGKEIAPERIRQAATLAKGIFPDLRKEQEIWILKTAKDVKQLRAQGAKIAGSIGFSRAARDRYAGALRNSFAFNVAGIICLIPRNADSSGGTAVTDMIIAHETGETYLFQLGITQEMAELASDIIRKANLSKKDEWAGGNFACDLLINKMILDKGKNRFAEQYRIFFDARKKHYKAKRPHLFKSYNLYLRALEIVADIEEGTFSEPDDSLEEKALLVAISAKLVVDSIQKNGMSRVDEIAKAVRKFSPGMIEAFVDEIKRAPASPAAPKDAKLGPPSGQATPVLKRPPPYADESQAKEPFWKNSALEKAFVEFMHSPLARVSEKRKLTLVKAIEQYELAAVKIMSRASRIEGIPRDMLPERRRVTHFEIIRLSDGKLLYQIFKEQHIKVVKHFDNENFVDTFIEVDSRGLIGRHIFIRKTRENQYYYSQGLKMFKGAERYIHVQHIEEEDYQRHFSDPYLSVSPELSSELKRFNAALDAINRKRSALMVHSHFPHACGFSAKIIHETLLKNGFKGALPERHSDSETDTVQNYVSVDVAGTNFIVDMNAETSEWRLVDAINNVWEMRDVGVVVLPRWYLKANYSKYQRTYSSNSLIETLASVQHGDITLPDGTRVMANDNTGVLQAPAAPEEGDMKQLMEARDALNGLSKNSELNSPLSELGGRCQRRKDIAKLHFFVPWTVLNNSADIALTLDGLGGMQGGIPFELIVTGVPKEDVAIVNGLNREDVKQALNIPKNVTVKIIEESDIRKRAEFLGIDAPDPETKTGIVKTLYLEMLEKQSLPSGEFMAIATEAVSKEAAEGLENRLKSKLAENISIRVLVKPEKGRSVFSLSAIINDWLKDIQDGNKSTIAMVFPTFISPDVMIEKLDEAVRKLWRILANA